MNLINLKWEPASIPDSKTSIELEKIRALLSDLTPREIPEAVVEKINAEIEVINSLELDGFKKGLKKSNRKMIKVLYEDLKWVPVGYYKTLWMSLGMSAFGIPMGLAFSMSLGNYAFLGIGLPIGMVLGMVLGQKKDADAKKKGLQLNVNV